MNRQGVIIDCDPGVDDAVALMLAFGSEALDILAVTTVGGNVPVERTARNARIVRQVAGREDVPVYAGAEGPLTRVLENAAEFHGAEGLGDVTPFEPDRPLADGHGAEVIGRLIAERPAGSVAVVVLGPMTNLALAMRADTGLAARLGSVVVMGGARAEGGNITASAEFNIWADPEAAAEVFDSGCAVIAFGLDVTHAVRATPEQIAALEAAGGASAAMAADLLRFSARVEAAHGLRDGKGAPLHDPCPVAWLLKPELFETRTCRIRVETGSDLTRGHTAVEFRVPADEAPHRWAVAADADGVFALIGDALGRLP